MVRRRDVGVAVLGIGLIALVLYTLAVVMPPAPEDDPFEKIKHIREGL